jgi:glutathione S-transferase
MQPILFYGVPQGSSFGSIVALEWLGQPYQPCRIEMLQQPWNPLYDDINPLFLTPAFISENGQVLTESLAIAYLDALLTEREWLLGGKNRTVADAYLSGIGRWVNYHQIFDLQQMYPNLHRYLKKLNADPAVIFAQAIEHEQAAKTTGKFMGHVTLEDLQTQLAA